MILRELCFINEAYDERKTGTEAAMLIKQLKAKFHVDVDSKTNDDGSITITVNNGQFAANSEGSNPNVVTPKNLSAAIDKPFRDYRQKGWLFSQPAKGSFTIGVK